MITGGFKNMNADQIIKCILAIMIKLEKSVGIVEDRIVDGVTNKAPSQNVVYDANKILTDKIEALTNPDQVLKYGSVKIIDGKAIIEEADFQWRLDGIEYLDPPAYESGTILSATDGNYRTDIIVGGENIYLYVYGEESTSKAPKPPVPGGYIELSTIPIFGEVIGDPTNMLDIVNNAVQKQESVDFIVNYGATTVIEQINLTDNRSSLSLTNAVTGIKSIQQSGEFLRPGKPHFVKNRTDHDVTIWHDAGTGNVKYFFPNELDLIIKPNEVIEFNLNGNDSSEYQFEFVGKISYDKNETDDLLDLKADLVSGKVPSSQLPSYVDDILEGYLLSNVFYLESGHTTVIPAETGKIYIDITTGQKNKEYRYSGSTYIQITNGLIASTADVPEDSGFLYFTVARVLATLLTGISFATGGDIVSTDNVLVAFGKLQKQITDCFVIAKTDTISLSMSDTISVLVAGDTDPINAPYNFTLVNYWIAVKTAPTATSLIVDVKKNGVSITSTKASIDPTEKTSLTGVSPVLTTTSFTKGDEITPNIIQVGSGESGRALKIYLEIIKT